MRHASRIRLPMLAAGFALAHLALAGAANAQIDEADRYQRCANNVAQVNAIDARILEAKVWNTQQIAEGRATLRQMQDLYQIHMSSPNYDQDPGLLGDQIEALAARMGLQCEVNDAGCAGRLVEGMIEVIDNSVQYQPWRDAQDRERAVYFNNIIALSCADFAPGGRMIDPVTGRVNLYSTPVGGQAVQVVLPPAPQPVSVATMPGAPAAPVGVSSRGCVGFAGVWDMGEWGTMRLYGETGTYSLRDGQGRDDWMGDTFSVSGAISGQTWEGEYFQPSFPDPRWQHGRVTWFLSADGDSLTGNSWDAAGTTSTDWNGTCVGPA